MSEAEAYYQSLLQQGYDVDQAKVYTREHFPNFNPRPAAPAAPPQPLHPRLKVVLRSTRWLL